MLVQYVLDAAAGFVVASIAWNIWFKNWHLSKGVWTRNLGETGPSCHKK
jgi:hypothetical protein